MKRRIDKRIEDGLTRLGADLKTPPGWEARVMKAVCEHKTSAFDWGGDIAIRRFCFGCGVTLSLGPANDDIPADEMEAAGWVAVLYDGPADIKWDVWDLDGYLHVELEDEPHVDTVALVNGETPDDERAATEAHLAECEPCSTALLANMQLAVRLEDLAPPIVEDRDVDKSPLVDQGGDIDDLFDHGGES